MSGFHNRLISEYHDTLKISEERLAQYDLNIVSHTRIINEKRDEKITLKYFQYLSLLFTEYYLDEYFNNRQGLLDSLNAYVADFNSRQEPANHIEPYKESDLNKIAFWNATGSGKTLLMHINYHQFSHYARGSKRSEDSSFILLTLKEGLSLQHIDDFKASGIPAAIYQKGASKMFADPDEIAILENTKLGDKDGDKTVAAARFGNKNVVFVDEGHRGASGDTWYKYRNMLCENGFSFEYSATFGQAIKAANNKELTQEYAKCILFDYSYKYFYSDGYGKDYNILNLQDDSEEIYFELQRYKNEKSWYNLNIAKEDIKPLLADNSWYKLLISQEELELHDYSDFSRWTKIAIALLKKYCERYYYVQKSAWEKPLLTYELVDDENENFIKEDEYTISVNNVELHEEAKIFIENLAKEMEAAKKARTLVDFVKSKVNSLLSPSRLHFIIR